MRSREGFAVSAARAAREGRRRKPNMESGEQRTEEWLAMRSGRLTASAFCNALGYASGRMPA